MKKYYNYSPEIPNTDDLQEPQTHDQPESVVEPKGRRRRGVGHNSSRNATSSSGKAAQDPCETNAMKKNEASFMDKIKDWLHSTVTRSVMGIILGGLGFWFAVAFFSYFAHCIADQSAVMNDLSASTDVVGNDAGKGGAWITEMLINQGFGVGALVIVVWLVCLSLKLLIGYPKFRTLDFTIKSLIAFISLSVVVGMLSIGLDTEVNWGGFHGRYINEIIYQYIGWSGAMILSVVLVAIFIVICLRDAIKWILKKKHAYDEKRRMQREAEAAENERKATINEMHKLEEDDPMGSRETEENNEDMRAVVQAENVEFNPEEDTILDLTDIEEEISETDFQDDIKDDPDYLAIYEEPVEDLSITEDNMMGEELLTPDTEADKYNEDLLKNKEEEFNLKTGAEMESEGTSDDNYKKEDIQDESQAIASEGVMTVNVNQIEKGSSDTGISSDCGLFTHEYKFPPADFLRAGSDRISVDENEQIENKNKIKKTLLDFGIPITSIEATVGPTVTLYEIRPDTGVKIAKIRNLVDDIALSLAAIGVRIIAPIPGKGTVGIEVANKDPQTVSMRTIIQSKAYQNSRFKLPVALGSTISNEVYIADLAKMPHLLVAGATGQGKSVGLNAIITSLLYSKRPEELKFVMVDPKRVEFSLYSKIEKYYLAEIPDSKQPIITNMENVVATLSSLCVEMDERYKLLEKAFVRQVSEYNEKFRENRLNPKEGHRFMPYIVVIIDEFADLIMTAGKDVEMPIARLAQLARAVGIHVIIATQRPSTNVITGMIKANFPVRIAFKVSSGVDSKTILDSTGAQQLIGRGDMLISNNGEMIRVQCAFVDTPEVEEVCDYIARQPYPQGPYILPEPQVSGDGDASELDPVTIGKKDPLFDEVARQVVMSGVASTSAVQRRYEIGYNRAGRIMDQLEAYGIVGPATGGKARNVLVDAVSLEGILASIS